MAGGYDISPAFSGSGSSGASLNSPFQVTGGGRGSAAVKPGNVTTYLIVGALVVLALFIWRKI
jgi:hypothetical protein